MGVDARQIVTGSATGGGGNGAISTKRSNGSKR